MLGGFLTQYVSWRAIFFINPPIAVVAIAVTLFAARESRDETVSTAQSSSSAGIVLLTVGLTALVLSLIEGNRWHWGSPAIIGLWIVAAVALVLFFRTEARVRAPMLDPAFFRNRTSAGVNLVAFIVSFALLPQFFFLTLYMQNGAEALAVGNGRIQFPADDRGARGDWARSPGRLRTGSGQGR